MTDAEKLAYAKTALRRRFADDLEGLQALADQVATAVLSGKSKVTVTNLGFEGGTGAGVVEWEAALTGQACEALLLELDPTNTPTPPRESLGHIVRFV